MEEETKEKGGMEDGEMEERKNGTGNKGEGRNGK
jgi:hypothetical protein